MSIVVISTDPYLALLGEKDPGNPIAAPINLTATYSGPGNVITIDWQDNPINDNPATSYTISRAGQPDVIITAPTTTYDDTRDIIEAEGTTIIWFVTLTNIDGTSNARQTSFAIPAETYDFNVELQTTLVPFRALGSPVATYTRASNASQYDYKGAINEVLTGVPRFMGARLDPDGSTYYNTRDDGTTPIDGNDFFADAKGPFGFISEKSSTNQILWSEQADNAYWSTSTNAVVTPDLAASPDLALTADKVGDDGSNPSDTAALRITKTSFVVPASQDNVFSSFFKADGVTKGYILANAFDTGFTTWYDLTNGNVLTDQSGTGFVTAMGDGWYNCTQTLNTTADVSGAWRGGPAENDGLVVSTLDGNSSVLMWGMEVEFNTSYSTTYIKTEAATVSREPEHLSYTTAGNLQANDCEITLEYIPYVLTDGVLFETFVDVSNSFQISINSGILEARKQVGGITHVAQIASTGFAVQVASEIVFTQTSTGGMSITVDGGAPGTFADNQNLPVSADMWIGPRSGSVQHAQCSIRLFKTRNLS